MSDHTLLKDYMEYRCGIYYWLKKLYMSEPSVEILTDIHEVCKTNALDEELPLYELAFTKYFGSLNKKTIAKLEKEYRAEYARLFIGPKRVPAPPYESVYCENKKSMFGHSTIQVRNLYKNAGLRLEISANVPDDFIGFELEFMYYLAYETVKSLEENNEEKTIQLLAFQHYFLEKHLTRWIERFTNDIVSHTEIECFKVIAQFTNEFIMTDFESLSELV
ncbi:MAG: TorD/DmsD family molecular chaperone [Turicibacter sp.]